jgi:hypothetical protein
MAEQGVPDGVEALRERHAVAKGCEIRHGCPEMIRAIGDGADGDILDGVYDSVDGTAVCIPEENGDSRSLLPDCIGCC